MSSPAPFSLREADYLRTWALFFVCNALGGFAVGAIAGGIIGAFLGSPSANPKLFVAATGGAGFVVSIPVSYFFFRLFVSHLWLRKSSETALASPPLSIEAQPGAQADGPEKRGPAA